MNSQGSRATSSDALLEDGLVAEGERALAARPVEVQERLDEARLVADGPRAREVQRDDARVRAVVGERPRRLAFLVVVEVVRRRAARLEVAVLRGRGRDGAGRGERADGVDPDALRVVEEEHVRVDVDRGAQAGRVVLREERR